MCIYVGETDFVWKGEAGGEIVLFLSVSPFTLGVPLQLDRVKRVGFVKRL